MPIDRRVFCAATAAFIAAPARAQFKVEISGVGGTQLPIAIARFRDEDRSRPVAFGHHPRRPRAQRRLPRRRQLGHARREQPAGLGRMARPRRRCAGGRLGRAPGRRPLRRALQALGRGQGRRPRRPEQRRRGGRAAPGRAPHRRLRLREAHRREGRVLDPHRLRHPGRLAAHAAGGRCRRRERPGRAQQRPADHLAGLVAERQGARLRLVREAEGGGVRAQRRHRRAPGDRRLPRLEQRPGLVARRPDAGGDAVARRRLAALLHRQERREPAPHHHQPGDRHRGRVLGRRPLALLHQRPRRQPADLPHGRRAAATPSASPSPAATTSARRSAPTAARSPT